jgi:glycosyltransferase involved in cell wall biosynthesis
VRVPRVTVLLPVFNAEHYLPSAVESVLTQSYSDFEAIVIDDGSTDASAEIIGSYARQDRRIRLVARRNRGVVASLNEGLAAARGEFIARMDADDVSLPDRFMEQVAFLQANEHCVALGSSFIYIDEQGSPTRRHHCFINDVTIRHALPIEGCILHPVAMFRSGAVTKIGGYRERYFAAEDYDLIRRLARVGELYNLPDPLFHYRESDSRVSARHATEQQDTADCIRAEIWSDGELARWRWVSIRRLAGLPGEHEASLMDLQKGLAKAALHRGDLRLFSFLALDLATYRGSVVLRRARTR